MLHENFGGFIQTPKVQLGSLRDIEQGLISIRKVQKPEHRFLKSTVVRSAHLPVEASTAKLRFAFRVQIQVMMIFLQDIHHMEQSVERLSQCRLCNQSQIVGERELWR